MDATRPNDPACHSGGRFYVICEAQHTFRAIAAGHGSGHNLPGVADFSNGRRCVRNFGNALDLDLTAGGVYVTAEAKTSFKGYFRVSADQDAAYLRTSFSSTAKARPPTPGSAKSAVIRQWP